MSATKRWIDESAQGETAQSQSTAAPGVDFQRLLSQPIKFAPGDRKIILDTCCGGASPREADELIAIAEARGLNPLLGECYFVKRYDSQKQREVWSVQISIDAMRMKADETGLYDGQDEPEYEVGDDGKPTLARVRVYRKGIPRPFVGVARFDEYVQTKRDGSPTRFWANMPFNQLAKCAEALGFRKAFPARFARLYTPEEMQQADNPEPAAEPRKPNASDAVADKLSSFRGLIADAATRDELIALTKQARTQGLAKALQEQIKERMREIEANVASMEDEERAAIESEGTS